MVPGIDLERSVLLRLSECVEARMVVNFLEVV